MASVPFPTIKAVSSCIRSHTFLAEIKESCRLERNPLPEEGDIVLVRVLSDEGAWDSIEDISGRNVRLYSGDIILSVLGTRQSGMNPSGTLPAGPVMRGDHLSLISIGGLVGVPESAPRFYKEPRRVQVEAFFDGSGRIRNLRHSIFPIPPSGNARPPVVVVAGTSAEVGKTTAVVRLIRAFSEADPGISLGAIKACGTGRLKDCFGFRDAGAAHVFDFVDFGWASTYNIPADTFRRLLNQMLSAAESADLVFVEIGGDLLEGRASEALEELSVGRSAVVLCANDAMGAMAGLRILGDHGWSDIAVCSYRQNVASLQKRLGITRVLDTADSGQITNLASFLRNRLL